MKCPFRCGIRFDYEVVGVNSKSVKTSDDYIETAQHAVFEDCYEDECPFYNYSGCSRIEE